MFENQIVPKSSYSQFIYFIIIFRNDNAFLFKNNVSSLTKVHAAKIVF
jgi:hypothetical protein